jgi:hypothetical protein
MKLTYESPPRIGMVIGTFAAVPYVHLHLESRRRNYHALPVLVHDDGSPAAGRLAELCAAYGADFSANPRRLRQTVGDVSAYVRGFEWAADRRLDVLAKMSRRFVPLHDWVPGLAGLAVRTQMPTFSQVCEHFNFGFRTECVAFHCHSWRRGGAYERLRELVDRDEPTFVEGFVHDRAREVARDAASEAALEYVRQHPRPGDRDGYAAWDLMPDRRTTRRPNLLWHDGDSAFDYARVAAAYGSPYDEADFVDPNAGKGLGAA